MNWALHSAVDHDPLGLDATNDKCLGRNDERRAVHVALNVTVDFDQTLGCDAADDF